jgi:hypothetical protein
MSKIKPFRQRFLFPILSALISFGLTFAMIEATYRIYLFGFKKEALFSYFRIGDHLDLVHLSYPVELNDKLGWIPTPKYNGTQNIWSRTLTVLPNSSRSNGQPTPKNTDCSILAVGDSFTFGDDVSDNESWPAYLEAQLQCPVINAGVCAYGIDQSSLRAKEFIDRFQPKVLVFGMIMDDIFRTRQNIRQGLAKPYYTVENDQLVLHEISPGLAEATREFSIRSEKNRPLRDLFDHSYLVHEFMEKLFPQYWRGIRDQYVRIDPVDVSCRLLRDLDAYTQARNIPMVLMFQQLLNSLFNPEEKSQAQELVDCLKDTKISIFDSHDFLKEIADKNIDEYHSLWSGHMTAKGNKLTAEALATHLRENVLHQKTP